MPRTVYRGVKNGAQLELDHYASSAEPEFRVKAKAGTKFGAGLYAAPLSIAQRYGSDILSFNIPSDAVVADLDLLSYTRMLAKIKNDVINKYKSPEKWDWVSKEVLRRQLREEGIDIIKIRKAEAGEDYYVIINPRIIANPKILD